MLTLFSWVTAYACYFNELCLLYALACVLWLHFLSPLLPAAILGALHSNTLYT